MPKPRPDDFEPRYTMRDIDERCEDRGGEFSLTRLPQNVPESRWRARMGGSGCGYGSTPRKAIDAMIDAQENAPPPEADGGIFDHLDEAWDDDDEGPGIVETSGGRPARRRAQGPPRKVPLKRAPRKKRPTR